MVIQFFIIMINYHIEKARNLVLDKYLYVFIIIFFQFIGTALFAYSNLNLINLKSEAQNTSDSIIYDFLDFSLSMLMCISYTRQFSGGLYNPAVAIFRSLRRTQRFPLKISFLYIVSQFAGAIVGSFIALYLNDVGSAPIKGWLPIDIQIKHFCTEVIGSFVMTFMVQLIIEKQMTFIEHNRQFYICIPLYYIIARTYSASFNCINPAFGFAFQLIYCIRQCYQPSTCTWQPLAMSYIIIVGSIFGCLVSVFMFQVMFRPLFPIKRQIAEAIEDYRRRQESIELKNVEKILRIKNNWTLREVINSQLIPAVGDQYEFLPIKTQNLDDSIESLEQDKEIIFQYSYSER